MPEPTYQWRRVSVEDIDVYLPWNVPVAALGWMFAFRQVESGDKVIVPSLKGERAGNGDPNGGDRDGGDGDGMTSSSSVDSLWVKAVQLAEKSQHVCQSRRTQIGDLPMSSVPPIRHPNHLYGHTMHQHQCGRIKFASRNVSQTLKVEKTYLQRANAMQPPGNPSKRLNRVIGPRCWCGRLKAEAINVSQTEKVKMTYQGHIIVLQLKQRPGKQNGTISNLTIECRMQGEHRCRHGRIKFEPIRVNPVQEHEMTYWIHAWLMQPLPNNLKHCCGVIGPSHQCDRIEIKSVKVKIECISANQTQELEMTYLGHAHTAQLPTNTPKCLHGVHRPHHQRGRIKFVPTNVSQMGNSGNTYLTHVNAIQLMWRPKRGIQRLNELTLESRMPGEPWRDNGEYGWGLHKLQSTEAICQHDTTYQIGQWCRSHTNRQTFALQVSYSIWIGHIPLQHILLHLAKYYPWDFTILYFLSTTPLRLWGSVGYKLLLWFIYWLHKH